MLVLILLGVCLFMLGYVVGVCASAFVYDEQIKKGIVITKEGELYETSPFSVNIGE
jgi:hypothetical protein